MNTFETLPDICRRLNECGVKYVLIGGCAIILHGFERLTRDIGLLIEASGKNIKKLHKALTYFLKEDELGDLDATMIRKYKVVRVGLEGFYVDLLTEVGDVGYQVAQKDVFFEKIDNVRIPVAGIETMIKLKQGFREIDVKDRLFLEGKKQYLKQKKKQNKKSKKK